MANYSSNNKSWGSTGSEYPDGYNYVEGDQPVDAWDNFRVNNELQDIDHLISLTNKRLESVSGTSHPSSPETGHLSHRTDSPGAGSGEQLFVYDGSSQSWERLIKASGDQMEGNLNTGGYAIKDVTGNVALSPGGTVTAAGSDMKTGWFDKQEGGNIGKGNFVPIFQCELADGETLKVTQANLTKDGFTSACVSGVDLVIAPEGAVDSTDTTTILAGDGTTLFADETGTPHTSYQNTSGATQVIAVGLDNGHFNSGYGSDVNAFGGILARKE